MNANQPQFQRLELKYRVSESTARDIRDHLRSRLEPDAFSRMEPDGSYSVHSLYLDSPQLRTYWDKVNGLRNRFKLRMRFYGGTGGDPVFLEIKRRSNEAIIKHRCAIRREATGRILAGRLPNLHDLVGNDSASGHAAEQFVSLMAELGARPTARVSYRREAWVNPGDESVRVTIDRNVCFEPTESPELRPVTPGQSGPAGPGVILELKFTARFPEWCRDLVRILDLRRCRASKYCDGIAAYGEGRLQAALCGRPWTQPPEVERATTSARFLAENVVK